MDPNQNHDNSNAPVPPVTPTPVTPPEPIAQAPTTPTPVVPQATNEPVPSTAQISPQPAFSYQSNKPTHKSPKKLKLLLILGGLFIFLLVATSAGAYAVAYEKINLNMPAIERPITKLVLSLPFMPKTPRMLLQSSVLAHRKVSKSSLNASFAIKSDSFSSLGMNQIDAEIKGGLDTTDPNNVMFSLNASVTKQLNVDLRKKDTMVYFKINKIPSMLTAFMQIDESKLNSVLDNWIAWDTTPLQTEARKYLESNQQQKNNDELISEPIDALLDESTLKAMKVSSESMDGHSTYKIHLDATASILDNIEKKVAEKQPKRSTTTLYQQANSQKLSDQIQNAKIDIWFDKKEHYVRKFVFAADFTAGYGGTSPFMPGVLGAAIGETLAETDNKSKGSMVMALTLDDFGKPIEIEVPEKSISPSEFYRLLTATVDKTGAMGLNPGSQVANADDAKRKNDLRQIQNALEVYYNDSERYPSTLQQLVTSGDLKQVPKDPATNAAYSYAVKSAGASYTLSAKLSSGETYALTEAEIESDDLLN